jgi:hypothetical protein
MGEVILTGPLPAGPLGFCMVCAGAAKHEAIMGVADDIRRHEASGQGLRRYPVRGQPQPAVAWGQVPGTAMLAPLCWTHMTPIEVTTSGLLRASGPLPPPPRQGPVLLDGSRG